MCDMDYTQILIDGEVKRKSKSEQGFVAATGVRYKQKIGRHGLGAGLEYGDKSREDEKVTRNFNASGVLRGPANGYRNRHVAGGRANGQMAGDDGLTTQMRMIIISYVVAERHATQRAGSSASTSRFA